MSDMYPALQRRLREVSKQWIELGTPAMMAARKRKGWSYETIARTIAVSAKTYERYEKRGAVPTEMLAAVAAALDLQIEVPEPIRVMTEPAVSAVEAAALRVEIAQLEAASRAREEEILRLVRELGRPLSGQP